LQDGLDALTAVAHVDQSGRAGKVVIPDVVMRRLEMPDAFASGRIQRQDAVAEQIRSLAIAAVVIEGRRSGRSEDPAALQVDAHAAPIVRRARGLGGFPVPGLVPELAGFGYGVKDPAPLAGARVEAAYVPRRRPIRPFAHVRAANDEVLVDRR